MLTMLIPWCYLRSCLSFWSTMYSKYPYTRISVAEYHDSTKIVFVVFMCISIYEQIYGIFQSIMVSKSNLPYHHSTLCKVYLSKTILTIVKFCKGRAVWSRSPGPFQSLQLSSLSFMAFWFWMAPFITTLPTTHSEKYFSQSCLWDPGLP